MCGLPSTHLHQRAARAHPTVPTTRPGASRRVGRPCLAPAAAAGTEESFPALRCAAPLPAHPAPLSLAAMAPRTHPQRRQELSPHASTPRAPVPLLNATS